jgi:hypothetical protein
LILGRAWNFAALGALRIGACQRLHRDGLGILKHAGRGDLEAGTEADDALDFQTEGTRVEQNVRRRDRAVDVGDLRAAIQPLELRPETHGRQFDAARCKPHTTFGLLHVGDRQRRRRPRQRGAAQHGVETREAERFAVTAEDIELVGQVETRSHRPTRASQFFGPRKETRDALHIARGDWPIRIGDDGTEHALHAVLLALDTSNARID